MPPYYERKVTRNRTQKKARGRNFNLSLEKSSECFEFHKFSLHLQKLFKLTKKMKKLYAFAFFTMMILSASARDKVLLNEDFSWVAWTGNLTDCAYNATGEVRYDYWNQAAKAKGWTSKTNWVWTIFR